MSYITTEEGAAIRAGECIAKRERVFTFPGRGTGYVVLQEEDLADVERTIREALEDGSPERVKQALVRTARHLRLNYKEEIDPNPTRARPFNPGRDEG